MTRVAALSAFAVLALQGCMLRARDLLPSSGNYSMQARAADGGTTLIQDLVVVRNGSSAAVIYLPDRTGVPPTCLENVDQRTCDRALGGLLLGQLYSVDSNGFLKRGTEVTVADPLSLGAGWVVFEEGQCKFLKTVASVAWDTVRIENQLVCDGKASPRGNETWRRGAGLQELRTEDGQRMVIEPRIK